MTGDDITVGPVTDEEIKQVYEIASIFSNKFIINTMGPSVRLTFGEFDVVGGTRMHASVTMLAGDAVTLYKVLGRMMEPYEEMLRQSQPENKHERGDE